MNTKRKSRGGGSASNNGKYERGSSSNKTSAAAPANSTPRPRTPDKEASPGQTSEFIGVYGNTRFTHALTSLIGVNLRVETKNKDEYEGILQTFSSDFEMALDLCHKVDPNNDDTVDVTTIKQTMVFNISSIVRYYATDVDLDFATKETFQTDTQISGANKVNGEGGGGGRLRELEHWQPEEDGLGGGIEDDEDLGGTTGWSANEMFAKNEKQFGVTTNFDPSLAGYTTTLNRDKIDSEAEARASRIAAQIENNDKSKHSAELENGDEEEAFSAVVRPDRRNGGRERDSPGDDKSSAYVPPGKRDGSRGGFRGGRGGNRTTPPPNRYDNYDDRDHRRHDRGGNDRGGHDRYSGGGRHRDREDRNSYGDRGSDRGGNNYNAERSDRYGGNDRGNSYSERSERGGGNYHGGHGGEDRRAGHGRDSFSRQDSHGKKDDYRSGNYNQQGGFQERGGGYNQDPRSNQPRPPSSHDNRRDERKSAEKSPQPPHAEADKTERRKSGDMNRSPDTDAAGLPQRDPNARKRQEKTKEQSTVELQDFHQKFNLKLSDGGGPPPQMSPGGTPTVSINPEGAISPRGGEPPSPRGDNKTPTPRPSPKPTTPVQAAASTPSPSPSLNKSSLNPNAKEFTLNPTAKEFTPRMNPRPSATPPRPQTPGTPGGQMAPNFIVPMQAGPQPFIQAGPQQFGMAPAFTPQQAGNQRPMRPNSKDGGHLRPDLPSPMQVTGQPILAQGLHPPGYFPPGQMHYAQVPGHHGQMMRPVILPQGMVPANLMHVPISTHNSMPGHGEQQQQQQQPQFVPATSQFQNSPAPPQHMWNPQVMTTPSPMHPPTGPPQQGGVPPPHNSMAATPPAQGNTPIPSPGPQIIGYQAHSQPNSLNQGYPMIIMQSGAGLPGGGTGLPQFHQGTPMSGPPMAAAPAPHMVPTSMAQHFPYMQPGQPMQMVGQNPHQQQ